MGVRRSVSQGVFQRHVPLKKEIILPLLNYPINFTTSVLNPSLNYQGRCIIWEAFQSTLSHSPLSLTFFFFLLNANCTELQVSVSSHTKNSSYCLLFPVQKPLNESDERNKHILGRNGLLAEPGTPETHKTDSDEGCTNREKKL